jgi:hypothetical protein
MEIVNLLKEYQDVFARDYKYLKVLVQEMGEMKIELIHGAKPVKNKHIRYHTNTSPLSKKKLKQCLSLALYI